MAKLVKEWPSDGVPCGWFLNALEESLITQEAFHDVMRNEKDECRFVYDTASIVVHRLKPYLDLSMRRKSGRKYTDM